MRSENDLRTRHDLTSAERKQMPAFRGFARYFPDAMLAVAVLSLRADRKHTPGADPNDLSRPQWVKGASADHGDCLMRHQMDIGTMDPEMGLDFLVHVAWRGCAQLQAYIDKHGIDSVIDWEWELPTVTVGRSDTGDIRDIASHVTGEAMARAIDKKLTNLIKAIRIVSARDCYLHRERKGTTHTYEYIPEEDKWRCIESRSKTMLGSYILPQWLAAGYAEIVS